MGRLQVVKHVINEGKCRGCGKCVEECSLELWILVDVEDGKKIATTIADAAEMCHCCLCCQDACPEKAILIRHT